MSLAHARAKFARAEAASLIFLLINEGTPIGRSARRGDFCRMEFLCRNATVRAVGESRGSLFGLLPNLIILAGGALAHPRYGIKRFRGMSR